MIKMRGFSLNLCIIGRKFFDKSNIFRKPKFSGGQMFFCPSPATKPLFPPPVVGGGCRGDAGSAWPSISLPPTSRCVAVAALRSALLRPSVRLSQFCTGKSAAVPLRLFSQSNADDTLNGFLHAPQIPTRNQTCRPYNPAPATATGWRMQ